jgi:outer membrane lipoprotein LolB
MTRLAALVAAIFAAGCATVVPNSPITGGDAFSGRLALRVAAEGTEGARAFSAAFDLRGDPRDGSLGLSTPLGSRLAEAHWSPQEVVMITPQGRRSFADLDQLTREVLGESVPVEAWFDWLHGRPWPGAPSTPGAGAIGFEQLGWTVDLARFAEGSVVATRQLPAPIVTVRIKLDGA